ncbi:FAD/FMN-containing dehydrogenase [Pseudonocardia hierapolitana]|uniref:FAD/FMN-containing dehydrogenase n=1 Tax=Pseudonocardia hierapolitana TaxID=1128676 RepID=A0A561SXA0_9PSEU|nr:FAD-binding protein [Pseudonocardia hierapolitana]TWF79484.1 FAD/FMN-containing dehydrogenase [Pseudonocardia hierapolitana]
MLTALDGEIHFDEPTRAAAADDFGHLVHRTPYAVVRPASARDVASAVRWAAHRRRRFAAQGCRHSVFGRSQADGGVVADMTALRAVHAVGDDRVTVDAGATWRDVLAATLPRVPAGLPDYLDLSVGGTLAVGGVGAQISRRGAVSDNVLEMEVVTGRGELLRCSGGDLFDAVGAGLGQVAVITRATLALVPAPAHVRRHLLFYPDLATMLADQRLLARDDRFAAVQGAVLADPAGGWTFRLDAVADGDATLTGLSDDRPRAQVTTSTQLDHLDRLAQLERALRANGQWDLPHPWLTTFVGDARIEAVVAAELDRLTPADLGPFGQVVVSAFPGRSVTSPLLRLPADDLCFAFNLIRVPTTGDTADRLVAANRAVYERIRATGGTLYPASALPMSQEDWRSHFGPAFERLREAKETFDPDRILTPGYEVF